MFGNVQKKHFDGIYTFFFKTVRFFTHYVFYEAKCVLVINVNIAHTKEFFKNISKTQDMKKSNQHVKKLYTI